MVGVTAEMVEVRVDHAVASGRNGGIERITQRPGSEEHARKGFGQGVACWSRQDNSHYFFNWED